MKRRGWLRYETVLMVLLSLNFGIVFFDRNAMSYLGPFVQKDLGLTNAHIGLIASGFSLAWGLSGFVGGTVIDRIGHRKLFLVGATAIFSVCSLISGLASSFAVLIAARMLMGLFEGPMNPVQQSFAAAEASPESRGLSMGFVQNFGSNLIGSGIAPLVIGALAVSVGWRHAFFVAAGPGMVMAVLILLIVREPKVDKGAAAVSSDATPRMSILQMLSHRNVWLSMVISLFSVPWMILGWTFLPLLYANYRHFDQATSSALMAVLGLSAAAGAFILPGLSDRIGRRPVLIFGSLLGAGVPLAALYWGGPVWMLGVLLAVFWLASGTFPLFMGTIPSETISARYVATVCGLTQGLGEAVGGFIAPTATGRAADLWGLPAAMWIMAACAVVSSLLALFLKETAPAKVGASGPALMEAAAP
jgi:MFS transporter, ACS family, hexuronate transporter